VNQLSIGDVYVARQVVRRYLPPTPLLWSRELSERFGCDVHVKYEDMTPIRSFKARGGIYRASRLGPDELGLACASTGNHGQGIAYGARLFGKRAVVVVPEGANPKKVAAIQDLGADLRVYGADLAGANEHAKRIADQERIAYVEDGEDPEVMLGCATLALEIVEQQPDIDALFVPVGGGNLLAACALAVKALLPRATLVGVQSEAAPAVYHSWQAGAVVTAERSATFAGGLATTYPGHFTFPYLLSGTDEMRLVSEDALQAAAVLMLETTGHLPEGAGAAALAGLLADPAAFADRTVVILLTGSNAESVIWERLRSARGSVPP
jgi:threonine dehydratase